MPKLRKRFDFSPKLPKQKRVKSSATAIAYVRVSTDEQALSPDAQRDDIQAWATDNGITIMGWHQDIGVSGSTPVDERPGLLAALEDRHRHKSGFVVIAARDRLSRDVSLVGMLEYELKRNRARLITAREDAEAELTPEAIMLTRMQDVFAEYERALIRRRTQAGLKIAKEKGKILGRPSMLRSKDGRKIVAEVHDLWAAGWHNARIQRWMAYKHGRTMYGRSWTAQLVQRCLHMERPPECLPLEFTPEMEGVE